MAPSTGGFFSTIPRCDDSVFETKNQQNLHLLQTKLQDKLTITDLALAGASSNAPPLRLTRLDRYLHGPTVVNATQYHTNDDVLQASRTVVQEMLSWQPQLTQVRRGCSWQRNIVIQLILNVTTTATRPRRSGTYIY